MSEPGAESIDWQLGSKLGDESGHADPFVRGSRVGRYTLGELIGRGAGGRVYRAQGPTGVVALKLLGAADDAARERFLREGRLLAGLRHPGIVCVRDAGEDEGQAYLACELITDARPLSEAWAGASSPDRVRLLLDVARAVEHAHQAGVLHRDLKPANVLVGAAGRPRVIDFGVGVAAGDDRLTRSGTLVGTPLYMAPEQALGPRDAIGPPCDVWSLGVMLYEALTDTLPLRGETLVEQLELLRVGAIEPPSSRANVAPGLEAICLRALRREPSERYASAGFFANALARWLASTPGQPGVDTHAWPVGVVVLSAFVVGLAVGLGRSTGSETGSRPELSSVAAEAPTSERGERPEARVGPGPGPGPVGAIENARVEGARQRLLDLARRDLWVAVPEAVEAYLRVLPMDAPNREHLETLRRELTRTEPPSRGYRWREYCRGHIDVACGEYEQAEIRLTELCESYPDFAGAWLLLGGVRGLLGDAAGALQSFELALRHDPSLHEARRKRALCLVELGRHREALQEIDRVLGEVPDGAEARYLRASLRAKLGDSTGARADYMALLAGDSSARMQLFAQGGAVAEDLWRARAREEARFLVNELIARRPENAPLRVTRAGFRAQTHDLAGARADLDHALARRLDPAIRRQALSIRGLVCSEAGELGQAHRDLTEALAGCPPGWEHGPTTRELLAKVTRELTLGGPAAALERPTAVRLRPDDGEGIVAWSLQLARRGEPEPAADALAGWLQVAPPDDPYLPQLERDLLGIARSLLACQANRAARVLLDWGVAREPTPLRLSARAAALIRLERRDEALADLDQALEQDPQLGEALYRRAQLHYEQGREDQALVDVAALLDAPGLDPEVHAWGLLLRGRMRAAREDRAGARADLEAALEVAPPGWSQAEVARQGLERLRPR